MPASSAHTTDANISRRSLAGATVMELLARYATLTAVIAMPRSSGSAASTTKLTFKLGTIAPETHISPITRSQF